MSIELARSGPILVKYSLNLFAIVWAADTCSFLHRKYAGNLDISFFFLFNMSFNVSQVFLISPSYLVNKRSNYFSLRCVYIDVDTCCIFSCYISQVRNRESPWIIFLDAGVIYREIRWILKFRM